MSEKTIWVPVKEPIVVVKADQTGVTEIDQSIAFEQKTLEPGKTGFVADAAHGRDRRPA